MTDADFRLPPPLSEPPTPLIAVGKYGASSVDAEDFSRKVGNWGGASKLIGDRWEELAAEQLARRLPWTAPLGGGHSLLVQIILQVDADPAIGTVLQRAGVSAPDLLCIGQAPNGKPALRATDCKVSLDTADREQTTPARLQRMFSRISSQYPGVRDALRAQVAQLPAPQVPLATEAIEAALGADWDAVLATEGLFVAPESGFNRWFLTQLELRRRTGAPLGRLPTSGPRRSSADTHGPLDPALIARLTLPSHTEEVSAADFLSPLAGWAEAHLVADLDGITLEAVDLSVAERCWRVAVGLRGAVLALNRKLFHPALAGASSPSLDLSKMLRQVAARRHPHDSAELVAVVAHSLAARRALWEREATLVRAPLSFAAWSAILGEAIRTRLHPESADDEAGALETPLPRGTHLPDSPRVLYKQVTAQHAARIVAAAHELQKQRMEDEAVLAALEERVEEWLAGATADATELAAEAAERLATSPARDSKATDADGPENQESAISALT